MNIQELLHIANVSGGVIWIIIFTLLVALVIIIDRTWTLAKIVRQGELIARTILQSDQVDRDALMDLAVRTAKYPQGAVLEVALKYPELKDAQRLSELIEETILLQTPRVDRGMWVLDTVITLDPLLGLLGTIIGIFEAFQVLGAADTAPTQVTGGVAVALIATAAGLAVAIIGLVFFNGLNNRARLILHQMEAIKVMLVNRLT
ncbi:MAG: MotA/TolQ/ExbB proton channel family protein [Gammaproteobacteria bacterium]|nr:MotA/TolQ/ExbB proton channel family protein [Gammaproteobacteria bacterium]MDE1887969.1 MotA/TolQ/ExbB proton channel family protein [Gammaproteobacteria bacterium]MDE2023449.1 MotA/TolQ/ExbB proton channel family protein [Gammaproteobacteria bacterium]MDE2274150.1 MotA/TolQ/ExbB proton channel family protein [Gammaproteobacteria bacterium]